VPFRRSIGRLLKSRFWTVLVVTWIFCLAAGTAWAQSSSSAPEVSLRLEGRLLSSKGYIDQNGRTLVPVRVVAEELGYTVEWQASARQVTVRNGGTEIRLWIGQRRAVVAGREVSLDTAPAIWSGRTLVPLRFVAENLGLTVGWDAAGRTVYLSRGGSGQGLPGWVEVKERVVNVRSGPGTNYARVAQVTLGTKLPTLERRGDWYLVVLPSGSTGWVAGWLVAATQAPAQEEALQRVAVVTADGVRLRAGPGTDYPILGRVNRGARFEVLGQYGSWYQVAYGDQKAWIAGWLVAVRVADGGSRSEEPGEEPPAEGEPETPLPEGQGEPTTIRDLSWSLEEGQLVVRLTLVGRPVWYPGRLTSPDRLYLDLAPAVLASEWADRQEDLPEGPVARLRTGQFTETTARLVFELREKGVTWRVVSFDPDAGELVLAVGPVNLAGRVVALDPGHGSVQTWGSDPGAVGPSGLKERDVVLAVALEAKALLEEKGARVVLTRSGETTALSLYDRASRANQEGAQVYVSIHANSSTSSSLAGTSTYYYVPTYLEYQREARRSLAFALQQALVARLGLPDKGVRQANFAVLRATEMPSALVELAFISNPYEEQLLADPAFRSLAARALVEGIVDFLAWH
jgi:N-acetylmuramoyl-L-alanine amidase